jgi:hypothetical protein
MTNQSREVSASFDHLGSHVSSADKSAGNSPDLLRRDALIKNNSSKTRLLTNESEGITENSAKNFLSASSRRKILSTNENLPPNLLKKDGW